MDAIILLICYFLIVNLIGFLSMYVDKRRARKHLWRIPETTLFIIAIIGGSIGSIVGMHLFRHKTRHWYLVYGIPAILIIQIALVALLLYLPIEFRTI